MSVLLTETSLEEADNDIIGSGYFQKINLTTIKGKTSCEQKKRLLNFMVMQVMVEEQIPVTVNDCKCLKDEFGFNQECVDGD